MQGLRTAGLAIWLWLSQLFGQTANVNLPAAMVKQPEFYKQISIEEIFKADHSWTATLAAEKKVILVATGDVVPGRMTNIEAAARGFVWPWEMTKDLLTGGDMTWINFEVPLVTGCKLIREGMNFCGDPRHIEGVKYAGVDIANLANNHTGNYGQTGLNETMKIFKDNGVDITYSDRVLYKNIKGKIWAFLGFNDIGGGERNTDIDIADKIAEARQKADLVLVAWHWGIEYRDQPDRRQMELAHKTIDAGADAVIGNHPHWVQPVEIYKGKLIAYAHGNFIFDQEWSQKTKEGVVGKYIFYDGKLVDAEYIPIEIRDWGQPNMVTGTLIGNRIITNMYKNSQVLSGSEK